MNLQLSYTLSLHTPSITETQFVSYSDLGKTKQKTPQLTTAAAKEFLACIGTLNTRYLEAGTKYPVGIPQLHTEL